MRILIFTLLFSLVTAGSLFAQDREWDFSSSDFNALGDITATTTINGLTIYATDAKKVSVGENGKEIDGMVFTHRMKLNGGGSIDAGAEFRAVGLDVTGNTTVSIVAISSNGDESREMAISNGVEDLKVFTVAGDAVSMNVFEYEGDATTLKIYSKGSGLNLYWVKATATAEVVDPEPGVPMEWNISSADFNALGDITATTTINDLTIYATDAKKVSVGENGKEIDGMVFTHRMKLNGGGSVEAGAEFRAVGFDVSGDATVSIVAISSNGDETREMAISNGVEDLKVFTVAGDAVSMNVFEYEGDATTLKVYSKGSGLNLYYIATSYAPVNQDPVLKHSYTFEDGTADDVVGDLNGTVNGDKITIADGKCTVSGATGKTDGYISLDAAALALNTYSAITIEAYIESGDQLNVGKYTMFAYFGNNSGGSKCFWYQPARGPEDASMTAANNDQSPEVTAKLNGIEIDDGKLHHIVAVLSADAIKYYYDGFLVAEGSTGGANYIATIDTVVANIFKGPDGWGDPNYNGSLEEFNIYEGELDALTIEANAKLYVGASDARLATLTIEGSTLNPGFKMTNTQYVVGVPEGTTAVTIDATAYVETANVSGLGEYTIASIPDTAIVSVISTDESATKDYMIIFKAENDCVFEPLYPALENIIPTSDCSDLSLFNGWGTKTVDYDEAYCGYSSIKLVGGCKAALDIAKVDWQPHTIYHVRAMVKTIGGSIGFLAKSTAPDFGFAFDSQGEWAMVDTTFTTGADPSEDFLSFNTCDFNSNCSVAYIDNYEVYAVSTVNPDPMVILDPAHYNAVLLGDNVEIVELDGTKYFKVLLSEWDNYIPANNVVLPEGTTDMTCIVKYETGTSGYELSAVNTFLKLRTPDGTQICASGQASVAEFDEYKVKIDDPTMIVGDMQVAGQETGDWGAVSGDYMYIGMVMAYIAEPADPNVVLDPATVDPKSLGTGWEVVELDGEKVFKVRLNGWSTSTNIPEYTFPEGKNAFQASVRYAKGDAAYDIDEINVFLKFLTPGWGAEIGAAAAPASGTFKDYVVTLAEPTGNVAGVFQVAGQENVTGTGEALVGDALFISKIMAVTTAPITFVVDDTKYKAYDGFSIRGSWMTDNGIYDADWNDSANHFALTDTVDGVADNVWEATVNLLADENTWKWGFVNTEDTWLVTGDDPEFTVADGTPQTLTYVIGGTGVAELNAQFKVYPNPAENILNYDGSDIVSVEIYNLTGSKVKCNQLSNSSIDVSNLAKGTYLIRASESNGDVVLSKFSKR